MRALCVSVHDVAPSTWPACVALIDAVRAVADVPLTLLVVPRFHDNAWSEESGGDSGENRSENRREDSGAGGGEGGEGGGESRRDDRGEDSDASGASGTSNNESGEHSADPHRKPHRKPHSKPHGANGREARREQRLEDCRDMPRKNDHESRREDRAETRPDRAFDDALSGCVAAGHELALHGYTHRDDGMPARGVAARWLRRVYTTGEGEFAAIGVEESRRRIALGLRWFGQRGWCPHGFVAPAWLLGEGAWAALPDYAFAYTTTYGYLHLLPHRQALWAPSLVYAARNRSGRFLSAPAASVLACALRRAPLVRLALHPRDASHPALLRHAQGLIARLLEERAGMTKAAAAAHWRAIITGTAPVAGTAPVTPVTSMAPYTSMDPYTSMAPYTSTALHTGVAPSTGTAPVAGMPPATSVTGMAPVTSMAPVTGMVLLTSTAPNIHRTPSGAVRIPANTTDRSAGHLPWR